MLAFIERSDGLLFATTYVFMNSAAYAENVGTSLVMRDGVISPVRSWRSNSSAPALDATGERFLIRSTLPSAC
jgi:hypothetical protein